MPPLISGVRSGDRRSLLDCRSCCRSGIEWKLDAVSHKLSESLSAFNCSPYGTSLVRTDIFCG